MDTILTEKLSSAADNKRSHCVKREYGERTITDTKKNWKHLRCSLGHKKEKTFNGVDKILISFISRWAESLNLCAGVWG